MGLRSPQATSMQSPKNVSIIYSFNGALYSVSSHALRESLPLLKRKVDQIQETIGGGRARRAVNLDKLPFHSNGHSSKIIETDFTRSAFQMLLEDIEDSSLNANSKKLYHLLEKRFEDAFIERPIMIGDDMLTHRMENFLHRLEGLGFLLQDSMYGCGERLRYAFLKFLKKTALPSLDYVPAPAQLRIIEALEFAVGTKHGIAEKYVHALRLDPNRDLVIDYLVQSPLGYPHHPSPGHCRHILSLLGLPDVPPPPLLKWRSIHPKMGVDPRRRG